MIYLATTNPNKIKEFKDINDSLDIRGLEKAIEVEEDGSTFLENSYIKAKTVHDEIKEATIADDSGLEIEALNNFPGIFSARFAYPITDYKIKCQMILDKLKGIKNRRARYACAITIIDKDGTKYSAVDYLYGTIAEEYKGNGGFGYDPIFIPDGYDKTFGELGESVKNKISHRTKAFNKVYSKLPDKFKRRHSL